MYRTRFSRYPSLDTDDDDVLGVIHLKDLFLAEQSGKKITDLAPAFPAAGVACLRAHAGGARDAASPDRRAAFCSGRRRRATSPRWDS